ncbi:TIGR03086 family protein [Kribbella qitaiheensis]|uniref:TIGR03086 family protein n=1 Tax=Kribbella qitaiheensis TaxID=1544730 RepID=A0A7G6X6A7_9ACTN|nr:TIGR03086 family metal-binding protein [Kribbella qitaiheensis]QNE21772.1 TIGR03086 family protein [Kribbella qitaiheensis]
MASLLSDLDLRAEDRAATDLCRSAVELVRPNQLDLPTPCAKWNLGELIAHLVAENRGFATIAVAASRSAQKGDAVRFGLGMWRPGPPDEITLARFGATSEAVGAAYADDAVLDLPVEVREFGTFPGRVAVAMHFVDYLVHGWDVARSIGRPNPIPEDLAEIALRLGTLIPAERPDDGVFAPVVPTDPDAPASERLLGLVGRDPKWSGA